MVGVVHGGLGWMVREKQGEAKCIEGNTGGGGGGAILFGPGSILLKDQKQISNRARGGSLCVLERLGAVHCVHVNRRAVRNV